MKGESYKGNVELYAKYVCYSLHLAHGDVDNLCVYVCYSLHLAHGDVDNLGGPASLG